MAAVVALAAAYSSSSRSGGVRVRSSGSSRSFCSAASAHGSAAVTPQSCAKSTFVSKEGGARGSSRPSFPREAGQVASAAGCDRRRGSLGREGGRPVEGGSPTQLEREGGLWREGGRESWGGGEACGGSEQRKENVFDSQEQMGRKRD